MAFELSLLTEMVDGPGSLPDLPGNAYYPGWPLCPLSPPVAAYHAATVRVQARQAIMQAGIACCLDRKTGLEMYPEPFSGQQFTLQEVKGGFELRSDLGSIGGEPLIVRFGRPPDAK